jgi:hypothetical protein
VSRSTLHVSHHFVSRIYRWTYTKSAPPDIGKDGKVSACNTESLLDNYEGAVKYKVPFLVSKRTGMNAHSGGPEPIQLVWERKK